MSEHMGRMGYLWIANKMLERDSGLKAVSIRYWDDRERGEIIIKRDFMSTNKEMRKIKGF